MSNENQLNEPELEWWRPVGHSWATHLEDEIFKKPKGQYWDFLSSHWFPYFFLYFPLRLIRSLLITSLYLPLQIFRWLAFPVLFPFTIGIFKLEFWEKRFNKWEQEVGWGIAIFRFFLLTPLVFLRWFFAHPWFGRLLSFIVAVGLGFIAWQFALSHFGDVFAIVLGVVSGVVNFSLYLNDIPNAFREILSGQIFRDNKGVALPQSKQIAVGLALFFSVGTGLALASISFNSSIVAMSALFGIAAGATPPGLILIATIITVASFIGISANIYRSLANVIKMDFAELKNNILKFLGFDGQPRDSQAQIRHYLRVFMKIVFIVATIGIVLLALKGSYNLWQDKLFNQIFQGFFAASGHVATILSWAVVGGFVLGTRFLFLARACMFLMASVSRPFLHPKQTAENLWLYLRSHSLGEITKDFFAGIVALTLTSINAIANFFLASPGTPIEASVGISTGSFAVNKDAVNGVVTRIVDGADDFTDETIRECIRELEWKKLQRSIPIYGFRNRTQLEADIAALTGLLKKLREVVSYKNNELLNAYAERFSISTSRPSRLNTSLSTTSLADDPATVRTTTPSPTSSEELSPHAPTGSSASTPSGSPASTVTLESNSPATDLKEEPDEKASLLNSQASISVAGQSSQDDMKVEETQVQRAQEVVGELKYDLEVRRASVIVDVMQKSSVMFLKETVDKNFDKWLEKRQQQLKKRISVVEGNGSQFLPKLRETESKVNSVVCLRRNTEITAPAA